jgi:hypothetical protein
MGFMRWDETFSKWPEADFLKHMAGRLLQQETLKVAWNGSAFTVE